MAIALEIDVESYVCVQALKRWGVLGVKLACMTQRGWPDRTFLIPHGRPFIIEFKLPDEPLLQHQVYWHKLLRKLGYDIEVHDNATQALAAIERKVLEAAEVYGQSRKLAAGKRMRRPSA